MVRLLTFYSDDLSSNPAGAFCFFCKIVFEKNENKQKKEVWVRPLFKNTLYLVQLTGRGGGRPFYATIEAQIQMLYNFIVNILENSKIK